MLHFINLTYFIIDRNTIKRHHLVHSFPDFFGLLTEKFNDITKETDDFPADLPSAKVRKIQSPHVVQLLATVNLTTRYSSLQGLASPRGPPYL